jgi:hypothetical protein
MSKIYVSGICSKRISFFSLDGMSKVYVANKSRWHVKSQCGKKIIHVSGEYVVKGLVCFFFLEI